MQQQRNHWEIISASEFEVPGSPAKEAARGQSRRFWRWFQEEVLQRPEQVEAGGAARSSDCFADELDTSVINIDWNQAARVLFADLKKRLENSPTDAHPLIALVAPPGCGIPDVLEAVAREQQLTILAAPPASELLGDENAYSDFLQSLEACSDHTVVIPRLERFFLRHEAGLALVRAFVERLICRGHVLLGCDSWAWAFLQHAIGIEDLLGSPLTVAPFHASRLDAWFRDSYDLRNIEFRQRRDDEPVFIEQAAKSESQPEEHEPETSLLIKSLSARARGNLGVAHALWRSSLRICDPESDEDEQNKGPSRSTRWVVSPSELELPKLANGADPLHRFILHAVLLHAGLSLATLDTLLPFSREEICRRMSELRAAGFVNEQNGLFQVSLAAYPEVRQDLCGKGFLVDAF